ncbi:MAG TPA: CBS domain-containing protein [Methanobacterium sp.]|jgi:CBS domain-containing protein|nr:MAG: CBS domain-containing protein [Methanobacterium sp.]HOI71649.1 CBS domain-containing protein [Methanobacterium sp.]
MLVKDIMTENVYHIQVPGNRANAMELMRKKNVSGLPVVKTSTKKLVGIISRSDLIKNPDEEQIALIMTRDIITVDPNDNIKDAVEKMLKYNIRRVPVVEDDELVGLITASDIINKALWKMDITDPVENFMIKSMPTTWERTPLNIAFEVMRYFGLKVLLALNKDGKLTGILTETDFIAEGEIISERTVHNTSVGTEGDKWSWDSTNVLYVIKNRLKFSDKEVKDVAATDLVIVTTKTSVKECSNKMRQKKIEQVPVINVEGELVGLVRTTDLIKALSD